MKDFYRVIAISPAITVGNPQANAQAIASAFKQAVDAGAHTVLTPELSLTGATCGDLYGNADFLRETEAALDWLLAEMASISLEAVLVVGLPVIVGSRLFNCAAVLHCGGIIGLIPKETLQIGRLTTQRRQFAPAADARVESVSFCGFEVPFGNDLVFDCEFSLRFGVAFGNDAQSFVSPCERLVQAGAQLILLPYAQQETTTSQASRQLLAQSLSSSLSACVVMAGAAPSESTSWGVYAGHNLIASCGEILDQSDALQGQGDCAIADFNPIWIETIRRNETAFNKAPFANTIRIVDVPEFYHDIDGAYAKISPTPFIPQDPATCAQTCARALAIQAAALAKRITITHAKSLVLGLSGGLDSTLALLVAIAACQRLDLPLSTILAITMPGFGTSDRTKDNATALATALGIPLRTIPIAPAVTQHFADIGHDPAIKDITYENAQARERTQILMDLANQTSGLVIGTGDLSEVALGFCTFGGDQIAMYGVNAGVPKTLMRTMIRHIASTPAYAGDAACILLDIVDTPVSPELIPGAQYTESIIGNYDLHDFYLYYFVRYALGKQELLELASHAFAQTYSQAILTSTLATFLSRFTRSQFKRTAMCDAPQVTPIDLSATAWQMPSDLSR